MLGDLGLLLERHAGCCTDVRAAKPVSQKEWGVLRDEPPSLRRTVLTDSLGLVQFGLEVIQRNKALAKESVVLQKTVGKEKAAWKSAEKELSKLESSVSASDKLAAKVAESDKPLKAARAEVVSLKE